MGAPLVEGIGKPNRSSTTWAASGEKRGLLSLIRAARKIVESDFGQQYVELAQLFTAAYYSYVLPPILILIFLIAAWWAGFENASILWMDRTILRALLVGCVCFVATLLLAYIKLRPQPCYLVDFNSFKATDETQLPFEVCQFLMLSAQNDTSTRDLLFQLKILLRSGLGDETYGPPWLFKDDLQACMALGIEEVDNMMFGALDGLFSKTGVQPSQVDFLIANASTFYPAPSLASRVVNRYKMREDVRSYNISGMGCAAGLIAVDLAKDLLRVHKNKYIVIVGTENITMNWYSGNNRSMMLTNCLFRTGSCALLLTNIKAEKARSKLELLQSFRITTAAQDKSYDVVVKREDEDGRVGTSLSIQLLDVAGEALRINMVKLVPSMMPAKELLKAATNFILRVFCKKKIKAYMPDFKKAFTHFCLHPGGRAVIDGIGENLGLSEYDMEPSRMTLYRFGNTSISGLWYAMAYLEAKERLKKGEKVWQVGLGSGFKCNSVVWKVLKDVYPMQGWNPWMDVINRYPVEIATVIPRTDPRYKLLAEGEKIVREEEAAAAAAAEEAKKRIEENYMKELHENVSDDYVKDFVREETAGA